MQKLQALRDIKRGEILFAASPPAETALLVEAKPVPRLAAGTSLYSGDSPIFLSLGNVRLPAAYALAEHGVWLKALIDVGAGRHSLKSKKDGFTLAWVTVSDKGSRGEREDLAGPAVEEAVRETLPIAYAEGLVVPDEERDLKAVFVDLALTRGFDLVISTGGTGVAPRDVTPEAALAVVEKRLPGFERAMTNASLAKTPTGAVSRAVAGTLGISLLINLPGSVKAVRECLAAVLPAVKHTIEKLQGDPSDCARLHQP